MSLRLKLIPVTLAAVVITCAACLLIQRNVIYQQGIDLTKNAMRATLLSAESTRKSVAAMRKDQIFVPLSVSRAQVESGEFRHSRLYRTIPVVAAWQSIQSVAKKEGY